MTDSEFLSWLRDRLIYVCGENPNVDFVLRLGDIIDNMKHHEQCLECNEAIVWEKLRRSKALDELGKLDGETL